MSNSQVGTLCSEEELEKKLASAEKLVVLEFVKPGSPIAKYVMPERDNMATGMKEKAEFYELDVDKFKKFAKKLEVEALPAFVVMDNFVKKGHVVGTDDLKKAIEDAFAKFSAEPKEPAANSVSEVHSQSNQPASIISSLKLGPGGYVYKDGDSEEESSKCSIL